MSALSIDLFPDIDIYMKEVSGEMRMFAIKPQSYVKFTHHKCVAEIVSLKMKAFEKILILGTPFLRQYVTVFDFE